MRKWGIELQTGIDMNFDECNVGVGFTGKVLQVYALVAKYSGEMVFIGVSPFYE